VCHAHTNEEELKSAAQVHTQEMAGVAAAAAAAAVVVRNKNKTAEEPEEKVCNIAV